mmetsp:Transcript_16898/g.59011  ORF Transcript_16898/g.59011 Transcript_16898/m.59011 type:complete len:245 (+) Transcript_16898:3695-4429(+)
MESFQQCKHVRILQGEPQGVVGELARRPAWLYNIGDAEDPAGIAAHHACGDHALLELPCVYGRGAHDRRRWAEGHEAQSQVDAEVLLHEPLPEFEHRLHRQCEAKYAQEGRVADVRPCVAEQRLDEVRDAARVQRVEGQQLHHLRLGRVEVQGAFKRARQLLPHLPGGLEAVQQLLAELLQPLHRNLQLHAVAIEQLQALPERFALIFLACLQPLFVPGGNRVRQEPLAGLGRRLIHSKFLGIC